MVPDKQDLSHFISYTYYKSSETGLAFSNSDVNISITVPKDIFEEDAPFRDFSIPLLLEWTNSIYDLEYLARCLEDIGMVDTQTIMESGHPICKFKDPKTNLVCTLGVDYRLGYESAQLIREYFSLDQRIKPLVAVVLYFTRLQNINQCK